MSRLFISHSSHNDDWARALKTWLVDEGWSGPNDIFLDLDPERGIAAGQRWERALKDAATRCEAVLFLVSEAWLESKWCHDEYQLANSYNKKLFALLFDDVALERLPGGLTAQWQIVRMKGEPSRRFLTIDERTGRPSPVHIAEAGLIRLKRGLEQAGIGAETFSLEPDPAGPLGWRAAYRGLEALEPEDAAVFLGRNADIVRGIDALRGLATRNPPRLLVVLGASGAGKSSFLRAGLWPRLLRDDAQWLPLRAIRAGRGGAIEGGEGLLAALEDVHHRFAMAVNRADLRKALASSDAFVDLLQKLRQAAARRAHLTESRFPLPVLCLDQGEELVAADAGIQSVMLLSLARAAMDSGDAVVLATIRSDSYNLMQAAPAFVDIDHLPFSLGPVLQGEIARIIREPAELLRRRAGPTAPLFDPAVVAQLQTEIAGEADALPILAFVLQRLMREHAAAGTIGLAELEATGSVSAAIESEAEAALADVGFSPDRSARREMLRRLFIPRLAKIDRTTKAAMRRISRLGELPAEFLALAHALTERRLLVTKLVAREEDRSEVTTLEVAHEALLRRWPTLVDLLAEDRDSLLLLDGVLSAAADWAEAADATKADYLAHRGSRLADAQALASYGPDWAREIVPAQAYLLACAEHDTAEREAKEAALASEQTRLTEVATAQSRTARLQRRGRWTLAVIAFLLAVGVGLAVWQHAANVEANRVLRHGQANLLAELADADLLRGDIDGALRLSVKGAEIDRVSPTGVKAVPQAAAELATAIMQSDWREVLSGHEKDVRGAAFSEDSRYIVTASEDKTARIWDAATGEQIKILRGHEDVVRSAVFSRDGTRIVTASDDNTARIWNVATGKVITTLRDPDGVSSAAFSPDGTRIVTTSLMVSRVWDAASGKEIFVLRGQEGSIETAAFSPDGTRILTASLDNTARIWNAATGTQMAILRSGSDGVRYAAFSRDGMRIVSASEDGTVRVWDVTAGKIITVLHGHESVVSSAEFSPDATRIVTASFDKTARIWDAATGTQIAFLRANNHSVRFAAYSPDGTRIVTAADKIARIWDATTGKPIAILGPSRWGVSFAAYSPDGTRIVTPDDQTARIWDATTNKVIKVLRGHTGGVRSAAFSPDGTLIVTASNDTTARVWNVATGVEIRVLRGHSGAVNSASFSPDGARIITASDDNVRIWDAPKGTEIMILQGAHASSATFSPKGLAVAIASGSDARIWNTETGREITFLSGPPTNPVWSVAFSSDGTRLVTASQDGAVRIWSAVTGAELTAMRVDETKIYSAAFSPDGRRVVTASADHNARIWDAATGKELTVLRGHEKEVTSASFSPDGKRVVTSSWDTTVRIWDAHRTTMSTEDLLAEACAHRLRGISKMTQQEIRLASYDLESLIDVCEKMR